MAGKKLTPEHIKLVKGMAENCMNDDAPEINAGMAKSPRWLSDCCNKSKIARA